MRWRVSATGTPVFPRTGGAWEWDPLTELLFGAAVASTVWSVYVWEERGLVEDDTAAVMEVEDQGRLGRWRVDDSRSSRREDERRPCLGSRDSGRKALEMVAAVPALGIVR